MSRVYLEKLSILVEKLNIADETNGSIEIKHLFSGAALYVDNVICASWSPAGLAFKLAEKEVVNLIYSGKAKPLKYFPKGHVKKGYVLFDSPESSRSSRWKKYFIKAMKNNCT